MNNSVNEKLRAVYEKLYKQEKKAASYILQHPDKVVNMTVAEVAEASDVSDATIMRLAKKAGFKGFYHLKLALSQQQAALPAATQNTDSTIGSLISEQEKAIQSLQHTLKFADIKKTQKLLENAQTVYLFGAGNSSNIAQYAAYLLNQLGIRTISANLSEMQLNFAYEMTHADVCLLISNSGSTTQILNIASIAKKSLVPTVCITSEAKSQLAKLVNIPLIAAHSSNSQLGLVVSTRTTITAVIDILINLLATDPDKDYLKYGTDRENDLAQFKS